ncbi:hypothetical protein MADA3029_740063 [Vibrio nigripulchritudo MADA3029]|nr:hypothetical protein VIBNIMADA3020_1180048 [Vibrio nigripulchritudo MADA3020]CCN54142.1 hypothetical protein VIBNIMADA3021_510065 [Vibrio nigripulchritudo MADA3021]CCN61212.1 hypothetical protein MADA3029_740063 [Vibrio nigripulchritudo MADA3029]
MLLIIEYYCDPFRLFKVVLLTNENDMIIYLIIENKKKHYRNSTF